MNAIPADPLLFERLSLAELEQACHRETDAFRRGAPSDGRYCLEIFKRALVHDGRHPPEYADRAAGRLLVDTYTEFIKANLNRAALGTSTIDELVQQVWFRYWQAANSGLTFPSLEAALDYLKRATRSALIEEQRQTRKLRRSESLEQVVALSGEMRFTNYSIEPFSAHIRQRFHERCRELLSDALEYQIFVYRYGMGFAPREIAAALARESILIKGRSPTARAVSDLLDRCFKRLEVDPEIIDLLQND